MNGDFNSSLKAIRRSKGITQEQLGSAVGVSAQAVSKWELNGFPDASVLPDIADFLAVTVDELFGRSKRELDVSDVIVKHFKNVPEEEKMREAMDVCRALTCGICGDDSFDPVPAYVFKDTEQSCFSEMITKNGWLQSRLNENLQYFLLMPKPDEGYDKILGYSGELVELFEFLAMPNALRAMYYMAGRGTKVFFTVDALSRELNIDKENAKNIIDGMLKLKFIWEADLNKGSRNESIYQYVAGFNFLSFITFAYHLINRPYCYNLQWDLSEGKAIFNGDTYSNPF